MESILSRFCFNYLDNRWGLFGFYSRNNPFVLSRDSIFGAAWGHLQNFEQCDTPLLRCMIVRLEAGKNELLADSYLSFRPEIARQSEADFNSLLDRANTVLRSRNG